MNSQVHNHLMRPAWLSGLIVATVFPATSPCFAQTDGSAPPPNAGAASPAPASPSPSPTKPSATNPSPADAATAPTAPSVGAGTDPTPTAEPPTPGTESSAPVSAPASPAATAPASPAPAPAAPSSAAPPAPVPQVSPAEEPPAQDPNTLPRTYHEKHFDVQIGVSSAWYPSPTLDPFAARDATGLFSLRFGAFPLVSGHFAFGFLAELAYGSFNGTARANPTSLGLTGLGLGLEARYHFHHRYYAFARATPGANYAQASLASTGSETLSGTSWAFAFGGHLGAAARIWGPDDGSVRAPRAWLIVEGGYRYAGDHSLSLAPPTSSLDTNPWQPAPVSPSGPDVGFALALTY
jgi:hypothetical protein